MSARSVSHLPGFRHGIAAGDHPPTMHRLLDRQLLKRDLAFDRPPHDAETWRDLLETIAKSYVEAEQGRELLERSLAISSDEMQELYTRQRAISSCAQALLFSRDDEAVGSALETIVKATRATCGWIDVNDGSWESRSPSHHRKWTVCGCLLGTGHPEDHQNPWCTRPEIVEKLQSGEVTARTIAGEFYERGRTETYIPITGDSGWIATLVISSQGSDHLPAGDYEVLRVAAGMIGSFSDQLVAHTRLTEREQELEALVRSKDQLIATIAHEIRTPLTAIMGYARLLADGGLGSEAEGEAFMAMLVEQGDELSNIVDDLVVVARADLGHLEMLAVPVDLRTEAEHVLSTNDVLAQRRIDVSGESVRAIGDPGRIRQVIRNLVNNASKYGGPYIEVSVTQDDSGAHLLVRDDGPGVPEGEEERIFEAYQRAHSTPGLTDSLGLGLHLSRSLARLMDGDVVYSRSNGLTTFDLRLPLTSEA